MYICYIGMVDVTVWKTTRNNGLVLPGSFRVDLGVIFDHNVCTFIENYNNNAITK